TRINGRIAPKWRIARWWPGRWTRWSPLNRFVARAGFTDNRYQNFCRRFRMRGKSLFVVMFGILSVALWAQAPQASREQAPWRGVGPRPCMGPPDVGAYKCPPPPEVVAVRAGRLFDSKNGQMLTNQVVLLLGERITDVGPQSQVRIPAGARIIDLSQATVLPGLIDAH